MYQGGSHHEVKVFIVTLHGGLFLLKDTMLWCTMTFCPLLVRRAFVWMVLFIGHVQLVFLDSMWGLNSSGVMPAPPRYLEGVVWNLKHLNLMEIHGCLCLPGHTYNNSRNLKLWILMDYMWEQQKSVVLPSRVIFPLCRVPTGEILLLPYFLDRCVGEAYSDMDTTSSRSLVVMEMPCDPLWGDHTLVDFDIFYSQESFRLLSEET